MHFQIDTAAHNKFVSCVRGSALDVVVNIDRSSKWFGCVQSFHLNENDNISLLMVNILPMDFCH